MNTLADARLSSNTIRSTTPTSTSAMSNRADLSVVVHPRTARAHDDHVLHALWLGTSLGGRADVPSNTSHSDDTPMEPNTSPRFDDERAFSADARAAEGTRRRYLTQSRGAAKGPACRSVPLPRSTRCAAC